MKEAPAETVRKDGIGKLRERRARGALSDRGRKIGLSGPKGPGTTKRPGAPGAGESLTSGIRDQYEKRREGRASLTEPAYDLFVLEADDATWAALTRSLEERPGSTRHAFARARPDAEDLFELFDPAPLDDRRRAESFGRGESVFKAAEADDEGTLKGDQEKGVKEESKRLDQETTTGLAQDRKVSDAEGSASSRRGVYRLIPEGRIGIDADAESREPGSNALWKKSRDGHAAFASREDDEALLDALRAWLKERARPGTRKVFLLIPSPEKDVPVREKDPDR